MAPVKTSLYCFTCKKNVEAEFDTAEAQRTRNNRYYVSANCSTCGRKMTSLVKSNLIPKQDDGSSQGDNDSDRHQDQ
jgi:DNA-directed RNA polymerase subunit RPC12/RpoP